MPKATTQVKLTIDTDIVSGFKNRCAREGVSVTSAIRRFMEDSGPLKESTPSISTRPLRRKAVMAMVDTLNKILELEMGYCDNIPEQFSQRIEASEHACDQLDEAIAFLEDAF